ncbi:phosphatidylserine decarboxylase-related protein [Penicillium atrosanguineum]|nr:phosphatidylserine decarboxylase-related protein [Penicillium atrosanguineum]
MVHTPVVQALVDQINHEPEWNHVFSKAISDAIDQAPAYMEKYKIQDLEGYFNYMDDLQTWIPSENSTATQVLERVRIFYFLFNQATVRGLQTPISPETTRGPLSWLSGWLVRYAVTLGQFLDTPESLTPETLATFHASGKYGLDDYFVPDGGWKSFNDFFARHLKPNKRPIAAPADPMCYIQGHPWQISVLLQDSAYGEYFHGGAFFHSILFPFDYHRMHAPVDGKVLECKVIPGQVMLEAIAVNGRPRSNPDAEEGYQWCQTRGLIVLDSPIGKVAILPIGMGHISSVTMTPRVGEDVSKGDEIGYFQFGGSDIIVVFEGLSNITIQIPAPDDQDHPDSRYKMGERNSELPVCVTSQKPISRHA